MEGVAGRIAAAMEVLDTGLPRLITLDLTEPTEVGDKICGGVMEVFTERIISAGEGTSQGGLSP